MTTKKEKPLVFCKNCRHYAYDMDKCNFRKGEKVTPVKVKDLYASPREDNKHNDCRYYKEPRKRSRLEHAVLPVMGVSLLCSLLFTVVFASETWLWISMTQIALIAWRVGLI